MWLAATLAAVAAPLQAQYPKYVQVGRVTAVYWGDDGAEAAALADFADRMGHWPGLPAPPRRQVHLIVTGSRSRYDSITAGAMPSWSGGAAFPGSNTIVLKLEGDPRPALRHELAHLALHEYVQRVPRWFDEGYAARAAGEWDRLDALRVNWSLAKGGIPSLDQVSVGLRGGATRALDAYALATTAVLELERLGGSRGLEPIITQLERQPDFDAALRVAHGITLSQFETRWQRDLKSRYGWVMFFSSFAIFWSVIALVLLSLWTVRRRRDRSRREALDAEWAQLLD